jgi:hypothetical protein
MRKRATTTRPMRRGWAAKKSPISFDGDPLDTVRGRKIATTRIVITLTAAKKSDSTTVADVTPATDAPGMLVRKMPIIATVPAWAGNTALIAVPPWEAPQAILKDKLLPGYAARRMFRHARPINADSAVFSASATMSQ